MSSSFKNGFLPDSDRHRHDTGEDTLRVIAGLPAPEGLADRVQAGLRNAPQTATQTGRVLRWRAPFTPHGGWMRSSVARGAAAAAIVCVVAGGGWTVYSRVSPAPAARVIVMPPHVGPGGGGFAPAGAKRVPETLQGPVLTHPVANTPDQPVMDKSSAASRPAAPRAIPKKKAESRTAVAPLP
jgi:hypothetical protein